MRKVFGLFVFLLIALSGIGQDKKKPYEGLPSLVWPKLIDINVVVRSDQYGEYDAPVFTNAVKALEGKVVYLPGYMVPFEGGYKESHFMFSALPLQACFFCGVGGPESVIEVEAKNAIKFTFKPVEIKGILSLNDDDPDRMFYILKNAEFVGEAEF